MVRLVRQLLEEHVRGLQIAVDDPLAVREAEPAQYLAPDVQRPPQRQRSFLDQLRERLALQQLHHQKRHAAVDAGIRHRDDVRVRERRQRPRLPLEALAPLRDGGRVAVQHLDRHEPTELDLPPPVHDPHPARSEAPQHLVTAIQRASDQRIRLWFEV